MDNLSKVGPICSQQNGCALAEIATEIIERLVRIEEGLKNTKAALEVPPAGLIDRVDKLESVRDQHIGQNKFQNRVLAALFALILALIGLSGNVWNTLHKDGLAVQETINQQNKQNADDKLAMQNAIDVLNYQALTAEDQRAELANALHKNYVVGSMNHKGIGNVQTSVDKIASDVNNIKPVPKKKKSWFE